ncbi:hypothetical protein, partial [Bradyrhizobium sp. Mp27]|uniref:hypothetical protein n=1 Tax=Bradyrhizobium sp. Mp27 TaxID=3042157 RepID=UPI00248CB61E
RRLFFVIFAPDSQQESSPLSGRKSTQATVRICGASSEARTRCAARVDNMNITPVGGRLPRFDLWGIHRQYEQGGGNEGGNCDG